MRPLHPPEVGRVPEITSRILLGNRNPNLLPKSATVNRIIGELPVIFDYFSPNLTKFNAFFSRIRIYIRSAEIHAFLFTRTCFNEYLAIF
jgi:hypothetical protein